MAAKKKAAQQRAAKKAPAKKASMRRLPKATIEALKRRPSKQKPSSPVTTGDVLADILPEPVVRKMPAALSAAIDAAPAGRQRAMRRAWNRGQTYTLDSVSVATLQAIKTDAGTTVASLIFECSEQQVLDKLGVQRKRSSSVDRVARAVAQYSAPQDTPDARKQPAAPRAARQFVDDAHLAVPLHTVAEGRVVKTPDSTFDGLLGTFATIVRQGVGSVTVRLGGATRRTVKDRNGDTLAEFDAPGRAVSWARNTLVVVADADGYDAACDERSYGDPHVDDDEKQAAAVMSF